MEILTYLLKVSACTVLFFCFYLLVLKNLTFFKINRFYLLGTLLLSFTIPVLQFEINRKSSLTDTEIPVTAPEWVRASAEPLRFTQPVMITYPEEQLSGIDWISAGIYIYAAVACILLMVCVWRLYGLFKYINSALKNNDGLKIVVKTDGFTNCSFFNYIFIDQSKLSGPELQVLLTHERVHVRQLHSLDKLMMMLLKTVLWFNPIIYLYNQALEQVHEYEADAITSSSFGQQSYAALLLRLTIGKSEMTLVHNFVKSPVKDRIKMLFNSKSKKMKKLSYLLVLPVVAGLVWMFAVELVYAQKSPAETTKSEPVFERDLPLPNRRQSDPHFSSADHADKVQKMTQVSGKTITGTVTGLYKTKSFTGYLFKTDQETYVLDGFHLGKHSPIILKKGDQLRVIVDASASTKDDSHVAVFPKQIFMGDKLVFSRPKSEQHPFLFEANKVRFNDGKITDVHQSDNKRFLHIDANGFNFKVAVDQTQTDLNYLKDYRKGDQVRLRFVHEEKTGGKSYLVNDWISISKNIRTFGVQNKKLFSRFYNSDGSQKVAKADAIKRAVIPQIISYTKIKGDVKNETTEMENPVFHIGAYKLSAVNAIFNKKESLITAMKASISKGGTMVIADKIVYDLSRNIYKTYTTDKKSIAEYGANVKPEDILMKRIGYSAEDSIRVSKDKKTIMLYGNAVLAYGDVNLIADEIIFNSEMKKGSAKNVVVKGQKNEVIMDGSHAKFDLNGKGKYEVWQEDK
ncbi:M56 family metallopeptidase [Pedobacter frigidisoli]|uniref:M56 family metallopeptidase n=1 Tax=Pedobacter frigidisoli TaxID=2530455 RepID=UPI0029307C1D|nr:M56 family metallopeptidase [Pedobacter frigidisoli]